jgi:superfamily II DNA/RNA helicase
MDKKTRKDALEAFRSGSADVLVSSDLASRGLDISDIKYVVSLGVPESGETYIHRAGRTARAGRRGIMVSIGDEADLRRLRSLEKKLRIVIYPKIVYSSHIYEANEIYNAKN